MLSDAEGVVVVVVIGDGSSDAVVIESERRWLFRLMMGFGGLKMEVENEG